MRGMEARLVAVMVWKTSEEFLLGHKCSERKKLIDGPQAFYANPLNLEAADFVPGTELFSSCHCIFWINCESENP